MIRDGPPLKLRRPCELCGTTSAKVHPVRTADGVQWACPKGHLLGPATMRRNCSQCGWLRCSLDVTIGGQFTWCCSNGHELYEAVAA